MNIHSLKNLIRVLIFCLCHLHVFAQREPGRLQQYIAQSQYSNNESIIKFYNTLNYNPAWIQLKNSTATNTLLNIIKEAADMGLRKTDYNFDHIERFCNDQLQLKNMDDSLEAELMITIAATRFYNDIAYGNSRPPLGYNGIKYIPGCKDIPQLIASNIAMNNLYKLIGLLTPALPEVSILTTKIKFFNRIIADSNFREVSIVSNKISATNKPLVTKLYQLGITGSPAEKLSDSTLKQKIKEAQLQFNLLADGMLRSTITRELNVPLSVRLQQLVLSINYYRWLNCLVQDQAVIVVNIPAAYLKVYHKNSVNLQMRMIVGKKSTPTPTLASKVDEVILYPYWHVPNSIATKELLPAIKRNPGFIDAGNYQVLNKAGKIVDPYSVNWHALSRSNFPYLIRQSTGCDNALGLIKLNFYNPFGVYLHDTPNKKLFMLNKRYFSHGCMRMEKPMEMGHLVLKNNHIAIDTLTQQSCLLNQSPITVKADEHMPVIVWYNPAGIDDSGRIIFYEDIYEQLKWVRTK